MNRKSFIKKIALGSIGSCFLPLVCANIPYSHPKLGYISVHDFENNRAREIYTGDWQLWCGNIQLSAKHTVQEVNDIEGWYIKAIETESKGIFDRLRKVKVFNNNIRLVYTGDLKKFKHFV